MDLTILVYLFIYLNPYRRTHFISVYLLCLCLRTIIVFSPLLLLFYGANCVSGWGVSYRITFQCPISNDIPFPYLFPDNTRNVRRLAINSHVHQVCHD